MHQVKIGVMTHRDKFEFVNELHSTMNREFARPIWRRLATPEPRESITRNAHCALQGISPPPNYGLCYTRVLRETL